MSEIRVFLARIRVGKTTLAVKQARQFMKKHPGSPIYTNIPELAGCYLIDYHSFDKFRVWDKGTGYALALFDEMSIEANNREFRNFEESSRQWTALCGHEKVDLHVFSQGVNFDKTIVEKMTELYTLKRFGPWTIARRWFPGDDTDIETGLPRSVWKKNPFPISFQFSTFRPRWYKFFNSWWSPFEGLPDVPEERLIPDVVNE